jgi:hypothetical protein
MPQVLAFAATALTAAAGAVGAVAGIAGAIPIIGGALNVGISALGMALTGSALAIGAGGLAGTLALGRLVANVALIGGMIGGTPQVTSPATLLQFRADPQAGMPYLMGRSATGGVISAQFWSNDTQKKWQHNIVSLTSCGPCDSLESFKLGADSVTFSSGAATGKYAGALWMTYNTGAVSGWSLTQPSATGSTPGWTSSHKQTGWFTSRLIFKASASVYANGQAGQPRWVGKWVKVYDPRLDSTYPGGSGSCRSNDESTWVWSADPHLHALTFALGRLQNSKLVMGAGIPKTLIDVAAFVAGANNNDDNGWTLGGGVTSRDDRGQALQAMLQAGGAIPCEIGGKLSCVTSMARSPVATLTEADVVGPISRSDRQPRRSRLNTAIAQYVSEDHDWQSVSAAAYAVSSYVSAEGVRAREIGYPLVQNVDQATQLAAIAIYDSHEALPITIPVSAAFQRIRAGDVITASLSTSGISGDLLVLQRKLNPKTMECVLICRTETQTKYATALALTGTAPATVTTTAPDPTTVAGPEAGQWTLNSTSETVGSFVNPRITFVGSASDNPAAEFAVFRYSTDGSTMVHIATLPALSTELVAVPNPISGGTYYGHISYMIRGVESAVRTIGPVTAAALSIPIVGGGTAGSPLVGDVIFDSGTPGSWTSPEMGFAGDVTVEIWGGGGSPGAPYLDPKTLAVVNPSGDGGDGGYSLETVTVISSDTFSGSIGTGGETAIAGGDTTCTETSQLAEGGDAGSADVSGSYGGAGGPASGGDTNTAGADGLDTSSQDNADGAWPAGGGHADSGKGATGRVIITRTA